MPWIVFITTSGIYARYIDVSNITKHNKTKQKTEEEKLYQVEIPNFWTQGPQHYKINKQINKTQISSNQHQPYKIQKLKITKKSISNEN